MIYKKNHIIVLEAFKIKNKSIKYQVNLVSTMIGRAKSHPYQTKEMRDAIKIFQKWLDDYHKLKESKT